MDCLGVNMFVCAWWYYLCGNPLSLKGVVMESWEMLPYWGRILAFLIMPALILIKYIIKWSVK